MMTDSIPLGVEGGPVSPLNYKRAVVKSAPREFTVEVLCPTKHGSNFSYGLKVSPVFRSRSSSDSRSTSSYSEYEIWRRWEDCLDFQETLEAEYGKMSKQKVKVLKRAAAGKKRNDEEFDVPYNLRNAAASFESLPEGPDFREVAMDVHKLIPQLTRKGTLFRVSRATVTQRGDEFAAMIQALFNASEDTPVLFQELRNCSAVRHFFAFWRRDKELLKKSGKDTSRLFHSNHSMSSLSTSFSFSSYSTNPSSPASSAFPTTPPSPIALLRHSMFTRLGPRGTTDCHGDPLAATPASAPPVSRRFVPDSPATSQFSGASHEERFLAAADEHSGSILFTDELLLQDEPGTTVEPEIQRRPFSQIPAPRSAPLLAPPEMRHQTSQPPNSRVQYPIPEEELPRPQPRARSNSATAPGYRNARIFISAPNSPLLSVKVAEHTPHHSGTSLSTNGGPVPSFPAKPTRQTSHLSPVSSQSSSHSLSVSSRPSSMSMNRFSVTSSISSYTQASKRSSHGSEFSYESESCVDLDVTFPNSPVISHTPLPEIAEAQDFELCHRPRNSASSFASFRTEASADGVLPLRLRPNTDVSQRARVSDSTANDDQTQSLVDEPSSEGGDDLLDAYFTDLGEGAKLSMETLDKELPQFISHGGKRSISSISSVGSFNSGTESQSHSPWSPRDDAFAVKAVYNESVIVFRAERNMSLATIRQRIKERFALHECVPLDEDFVLAYLPSRTPVINGVARRGRSNSIASTTSDMSQLRLLQTEVDWQAAMLTCNGKVTLRVLDAEAFS